MINAFSELRKNKQSNFKKLQEKLASMSKGFNNNDERYWKPTFTKAKTASAVFRFLPAPPGEDSPFVRIYSHFFKGPTGLWYVENSLTTLGKDDPVGEYNAKLWAQGEGSEGRKVVLGDFDAKIPPTKRKLNYVSNIYVVSDPENKEAEGKVWLFQYGAQIFKKIEDAANPKFPDFEPFDAFDLWHGSNLKFRAVTNKGGAPNYEQSEWDLVDGKPRGPLFQDDETLEKIWKSEHSLQDLLAPANFKSYNELKARLMKVMHPEGETVTEFHQTTPPWENDHSEVSEVASEPTNVVAEEDSELEMFKALRDS